MKTKIGDQIYLIDDDDADLIEDESNSLQDYQESAQKITQDLFKSMDIISQYNLAKQQYNKTIKAVIVACEDESLGKYKVQYQDGTWTAYAENVMNSVYQLGTSVYVTVPNSDMKENKIILGSTKDNTEQSNILLKNELDNFISNGYNLLEIKSGSGQYYLWSDYPQEQILYQYNSNNNKINFDFATFNQDKENIDRLLLQANIQTMLPPNRQYRGNYGIIIDMQFYSNQDNQEIITRSYILDVDNMTGDPYVFTSPVTQKILFEIDGKNFIRINKISLFVKDFIDTPASSKGDNYNIIISNLSLMSGRIVTDEEKNGVLLILNAKKGFTFGEKSISADTREIQAIVKVQMKQVNLKTQKLPFYWFRQDATITSYSKGYCKYGGQGWECLNKLSQNEDNHEKNFLPGNNKFIVENKKIYTTKTKYKCVVIYNGVAYSKEFEIKKLNAGYKIQIVSDEGFNFHYDSGNPTLQCVLTPLYPEYPTEEDVADINDFENFQYVWASINKFGNFTSLENDSNTYKVNISKIISFTTFKCSVYATSENGGKTYIGTAQALITNKLQGDVDYALVINNGTQLFLYNEEGLSPFETGLNDPMPIPALTFTIYDNKGNPLDENALQQVKVEWTAPTENTMLKIDDRQFDSEDIQTSLDEKWKTYKNVDTFSYTIAKKYNISNNQNDITLKVNYNGMILTTKTNFTFLKQGDPGTNGTEYQVKIVPNATNDMSNITPIIYYNESGKMVPSWTLPSQQSGWFLVQIWQNGERIYRSNQGNGDNIEITWNILSNNNTEVSYFKYNESDFNDSMPDFFNLCIPVLNSQVIQNEISNTIRNSLAPANILQARVKIDSLINYATFPIITARIPIGNDIEEYNVLSYHITLKKNSGFSFVQYKADGTQPSYSQTEPFEISIEQRENNGTYSEISDYNGIWYTRNSYKNYKNIYQYQYENLPVPNSNKKGWQINLSSSITNPLYPAHLKINSKLSEKNELYLQAANQYDGLIKTEGIDYEITINSNKIHVHIPIHFLLNRYFHADLNDWDGNSIDLGGDDKDIILTPQIGAGQKNSDNSFTGLVMGKIQKDDKQQVGLFGYNSGQQTIMMDAKTGKTVLGRSDNGQIEIDPSQNGAALIKSGNYNSTDGTGMLINFSQGSATFKNQKGGTENTVGPEIKFGSGNFSVSKEGYLISKGGGSIAGWEINDNFLQSEDKYTGINNLSDTSSSNKIGTFKKPDFQRQYIFNWIKDSAYIKRESSNITIENSNYVFFPVDKIGGQDVSYSIQGKSCSVASSTTPLKTNNLSNFSSSGYIIQIKNNGNLLNIPGDDALMEVDEYGREINILGSQLGEYLGRLYIQSFVYFEGKNKSNQIYRIGIENSIQNYTITENNYSFNLNYTKANIENYKEQRNQYLNSRNLATEEKEQNKVKLYFQINLFFLDIFTAGDTELLPSQNQWRQSRDIFILNGQDSIIDNYSYNSYNNTEKPQIFDINYLNSKYLKTNNEESITIQNKLISMAFWAGSEKNNINESQQENNQNLFCVSHDGYLITTAANIGGGRTPIYIGKSPITSQPGKYYSAIFSNLKFQKNTNKAGFYLGQDGLGIGGIQDSVNNKIVSKFQVDADGTFFAVQGFIGSRGKGWTVAADKMYNQTESGFEKRGFFLSPTIGISIKNADTAVNDPNYFSVTAKGVMTASNATIANWVMTNNQLRTGYEIDDPNDSNKKITIYPTTGDCSYDSITGGITITSNAWVNSQSMFVASPKNINLGDDGIRVKDFCFIGKGGLYVKKAWTEDLISQTANIGGWAISEGTIYKSGITLDSSNKALQLDSATLYGDSSTFKFNTASIESSELTYGIPQNQGLSSNQPLVQISTRTNGCITLRSYSSYNHYIKLLSGHGNGYSEIQLGQTDNVKVYMNSSGQGNIYCGGNISSPSLNQGSSSIKIKDIDRPYTPIEYQDFYNLKVYKAKYKDGYLKKDLCPWYNKWNGQYFPMFVAEQIEKLEDNAVKYNQNGQVLDWHERVMIPIQHLLIQDLNNRIKQLQKKIQQLENK